MKSRTRLSLAALCAALLAGPALAADVKVSGIIFGQYSQYLSRGDYSSANAGAGNDVRGKGEFSVTRIYLTGEAKFSPTIKGKVVLEGNTAGQTSGPASAGAAHTHTIPNNVFLKNAFGDYMLCDHANVTFGLIGTPWIGFEEGIWGRRFVAKTFLDDNGLLASADKGLGVLGRLPKGFGDYHLTYVNGEGTTTNETSAGTAGRYKDYQGRLSVAPFPRDENLKGLRVHAYVQQGQQMIGEAKRRDRYAGGLSYEHAKFHLMWSYGASRDGDPVAATAAIFPLNRRTDSYSIHGSVKLPYAMSVFGRFDRYSKANSLSSTGAAVQTEAYSKLIMGVDRKLADGARISLNVQSKQPLVADTATQLRANDTQLLGQIELKF